MSEWLEKKSFGVPNTWLVIAVIVVIMFTGIGAGIRARLNVPSGQEILGMEEPTEWVGEPGKFDRDQITVSLVVSQSDWQAGGSATPTTPVYTLYHGRPGKDSSGNSLTVAGEDIQVKASENGRVWIDCYGGTDFYLVEDALRDANPEIKNVVKEDFDGDGKLDFLAELDLSGFLIGSQEFKPSYTLSMPLLDVDITGVTSSNPADQSSIGTSETVVTIKHTISAVTAEDGLVISELYYTTNSTREGDDLRFEELYITGQWTVDGPTAIASPVHKTYGDYSGYYIYADESNEPLDDKAMMAYRDTGRADDMTVSVNIRVTGETSEVYVVTLYITLVQPDGTVTEVSDAVTLSI
jgi:hypothetical protein